MAQAVAEAAGVSASSLGLRFDRVVVRLLDRLRRSLEVRASDDVAVVLTLTAPLRAPGRLAGALEAEIAALLQDGRAGSERTLLLLGNHADLRLVQPARTDAPRLLGFVRNPGVEAAKVLDLAERWLRPSSWSDRGERAHGRPEEGRPAR